MSNKTLTILMIIGFVLLDADTAWLAYETYTQNKIQSQISIEHDALVGQYYDLAMKLEKIRVSLPASMQLLKDETNLNAHPPLPK